MKERVSFALTPVVSFEEVIDIWIVKAHTLLKCVTCATVTIENGVTIRTLHPKKRDKSVLRERVTKTDQSVRFEEVDGSVKYTIELDDHGLTLNYEAKETDIAQLHPALKSIWLIDVLMPKLAQILGEVRPGLIIMKP